MEDHRNPGARVRVPPGIPSRMQHRGDCSSTGKALRPSPLLVRPEAGPMVQGYRLWIERLRVRVPPVPLVGSTEYAAALARVGRSPSVIAQSTPSGVNRDMRPRDRRGSLVRPRRAAAAENRRWKTVQAGRGGVDPRRRSSAQAGRRLRVTVQAGVETRNDTPAPPVPPRSRRIVQSVIAQSSMRARTAPPGAERPAGGNHTRIRKGGG